jgi:ATP-dependent DNA helicase RecQ
MVSMTATATKQIMKEIIKVCGMREVAHISESPNRTNVTYAVYATPILHHSDVFEWLIEDLRKKGKECEKVLIFCCRIEDCVNLYYSFATSLGDASYASKREHSLHKALYGMYHAKITRSEKEMLLVSFSKPEGNCQVVFATIAFGMGVNIPDIHTIIHLGPSSNADNYLQESGRVGRNGVQSDAVILLQPGAFREMLAKT